MLIQSLLETLEETKRQQEEEELEARQAEKQEKERQAELLKKNKQRNTPPSSSQGGKASASTTSNGHAPPLRPERSKDRTQPSERAKHSAQDNASSSSSSSSSLARRDAQERETGFSAFRSHLTNFLSSDSQSSISRGNHHSNSSRDLSRKNSGNNSIDIIKIYLSKIVHSRLLKLLLAFFIITGFWRRRLARSGRNIGIRKTLMRLREKVVETVKMGGSLGFL